MICNDAGVFDVIAKATREDTPVATALAGYERDTTTRGNLRRGFDGRYKLGRPS